MYDAISLVDEILRLPITDYRLIVDPALLQWACMLSHMTNLVEKNFNIEDAVILLLREIQ